ncbi:MULTISPECIES: imelysin family protein [unclassified Flavobacterium]|uniref:imelysin family protein n=1 Tax=unclassified Flavobacterium TaxID=196869 RepID=UPI003F93ACF3
MKKKLFIFFSALITIVACSSSDNSDGTTGGSNYDRKVLLTNWADNIIIPSYVNYQAKVEILAANISTFNAATTEVNLQAVRTSWLEAYKAYQYVAIYSFGKSEEINLKESANTYPTSASGIEANITAGTYNLALLSQFDKQGFPALDYLINGLGNTDAVIMTYYSTNANATKYKKYLTDVTTRLKTNVDTVLADWNSGYKATYIANSGTSVSSSVNITTNNFVKNLEKNVRSGKLGIPSGALSSGVTFPEKVEAYYKNDVSKELLNTAIKASQDFFNGKHFNSATTGEGLKSYLDYLNTVRSGEKLSTIINNQFATIFTVNATLNNSFSNQIAIDNTKMLSAYDALQQNIVYTKLDMMQALNITIDYVDGDGD